MNSSKASERRGAPPSADIDPPQVAPVSRPVALGRGSLDAKFERRTWAGPDALAAEILDDHAPETGAVGGVILGRGADVASSPKRRPRIEHLVVVGDVVALALAAAAAAALHPSSTSATAWTLVIGLAAALACMGMTGEYRREQVRSEHLATDGFGSLAQAVTLGVWATCILAVTAFGSDDVLVPLSIFWAVALIALPTFRVGTRSASRRLGWSTRRVVVVGAGKVGRLVAEKYRNHPECGESVVGFVDAQPLLTVPSVAGEPPVLGDIGQLVEDVRRYGIDRVVVACPEDSDAQLSDAVRRLRRLGVHVDIVPRLFDVVGPNATIHQLEGLAMVGLPPLRLTRGRLFVKRALDVVVSVAAMLFLLPVFAAIAALVRLDSPGPILYRGQRIGRGGQAISVLKFRTMHVDADERLAGMLADEATREQFERLHKFVDDARITRIGRFMRRTSLDELPQFVNVLRGDLSLVGPRPITIYEWDRCVDTGSTQGPTLFGYWAVDDLRPGLTGYWQVSGRSAIGFEERIRLDMAYLSCWSLALDFKILLKTVRALVSGSGAY